MFFKAAHQGKNNAWRYIVGFLVLIALHIIGSIPLGIVLSIAAVRGADVLLFQETLDFSVIGISNNTGFVLMMVPFLTSMLGMLFIIPRLHFRPLGLFISAFNKVRWERVFFAILLWLIMLIVTELIFMIIQPDNYELIFDLKKFIPLLFLTFLLIPMQAGFEELALRGYLMQGIGMLGGYKWIPLLITSILFGLLHSMNPEIEKFGFWYTMPYYIGFGLFLGAIAIMDKGIEIPMGIHVINNIYGSLFITFSGSALQTPAIMKMKEYNIQWSMVSFLIAAVIFLYIAAKRYNWPAWKKLIENLPSQDQ